MAALQLLHADHLDAVLAFEIENRCYFATWVTDRGDAYFEGFEADQGDLLREQALGTCAFYLMFGEDDAVVGRFNLYDIENTAARLGYRVAESAAGHGVATEGVRELCTLAADRHGVKHLRAATSTVNTASQKVLTKAGFALLGPAPPEELGGKPGSAYQRDL